MTEGRGLTPEKRTYTLTLDAYEAANLLYALGSHRCLNSGDWYAQVRDRLRNLTDETVPVPNALWCLEHGHIYVEPMTAPARVLSLTDERK